MSLSRAFANLIKNTTKMIAEAEEQSKLVEGEDEQKAAFFSSIDSDLSRSMYNKKTRDNRSLVLLQSRFKIALMQYAKAQYGVSANDEDDLQDILFHEDIVPKRRKKEVISLLEEPADEAEVATGDEAEIATGDEAAAATGDEAAAATGDEPSKEADERTEEVEDA